MDRTTNPGRTQEASGLQAPGLGASQRALLGALKRSGPATIPQLGERVGLSVETVRQHLGVLEGHELIVRRGTRARGRGRPEVVYALTPAAERLFPRREGEVLGELARYLVETGNQGLLADFFERFIGGREEAAMSRVEGLTGQERVEEVARIMTELGFMAEVDGAGGEPRLKLCHCPIRDLVAVDRMPCRAEIGFVARLMGGTPERLSYIPAGDACCSYGGAGNA